MIPGLLTVVAAMLLLLAIEPAKNWIASRRGRP